MSYLEKFLNIKNNTEQNNQGYFKSIYELKELLLSIPKSEQQNYLDLINEIKMEIYRNQNLIDFSNELLLGIIDFTKPIKLTISQVENNNSTQELFNILNFYSQLILKKSYIKNRIIYLKNNCLNFGLGEIDILDSKNRVLATLPTLYQEDINNESQNYKYYLDYILVREIEILAKPINSILNNYIKRHKQNIEQDIYELIKDSLFINKSNINSFVKTFKFLLYDYDIETSLQKLIPLLEDSTKYICYNNGINPNRLKQSKKENEKFVEETNMFGYLWKLDLFKNLFGEDIVFNILSLFDSPYGANLRNRVAHGDLSSEEYKNIINYYAIILIFWLCVYCKNK